MDKYLLTGMLLLLPYIFSFCAEEKFVKDLAIFVEPVKNDSIYKTGETAKFKIRVVDSKGKNLEGRRVRCSICEEFRKKADKIIVTGRDAEVAWKSDVPGSVQVSATLLDDAGKSVKKDKNLYVTGSCGAFFSPEKIVPGAEMPKDFDAFWNAQKDLLKKMPMNPKLVKENVKNSKFDVFDVTLDCPGGMPVRGYLAVPKGAKQKSLSAVVSYQGAGVYTSRQPLVYGSDAISMNINAHGIDNGQSKDFYKNLAQGKLKGYPHFGKTDREKFYFRGMYLRVLRALEFIKTRPEWNGKTLIVHGGSQGGGQSIAAAALDPDVTFCYAEVPALSDHAAGKFGRQAGWPRLYYWKDGKPRDAKVAETAQYFDNVNFARKIHCEIWLTTGFVDGVCSPSGVFAVYNSLPAGTKKYIRTAPAGGHNSKSKSKEASKRMFRVISGK